MEKRTSLTCTQTDRQASERLQTEDQYEINRATYFGLHYCHVICPLLFNDELRTLWAIFFLNVSAVCCLFFFLDMIMLIHCHRSYGCLFFCPFLRETSVANAEHFIVKQTSIECAPLDQLCSSHWTVRASDSSTEGCDQRKEKAEEKKKLFCAQPCVVSFEAIFF